MIAKCSELFTQYSTVVYVGMALGKPVHSFFDLADLRRNLPDQNGGTAGETIAGLCRNFLDCPGPHTDFACARRQLVGSSLTLTPD